MVAEKQEADKSYSRALRVTGRYLDSEPSYNMSISETSEGFTIRSHSTSASVDERVKHLQWDRIEHEDQYYAAAARGTGRRQRPSQESWWNFPCTHEDALRKLGSILDEQGASSVTIDQRDNGLDVAYMRANAESGQALEKVQKLYGPDELCAEAAPEC